MIGPGVCLVCFLPKLRWVHFGCWNVDLLLPETAPTGIFAWQDIITMEYEEELYVNNLSADSTLIVNPAGINDGKGRANLS